MRNRLSIVIVTTLLFCSPVFADEPGSLTCPAKPSSMATVRKLAGTYFSQAEQSFEDEAYIDALSQFLCSMVMIEHENTVINIKKTLDEIADKPVALRFLKEYLDAHPNGELNDQIALLAKEIEDSLVEEGTSNQMAKCPEPPPPPAPACPTVAPIQLTEDEAVDRAHRVLWITGWTDVGIGAATFLTAVVTQGIAASAKNKAQRATRYDEFLDQRDRNKSFQTAATALFVASVVVAGTGVVHLLLHSEEQKKRSEKSPNAKPATNKDNNEKDDAPMVSVVPGMGFFGIKGSF